MGIPQSEQIRASSAAASSGAAAALWPMRYISDEGAAKAREYRYSGSDNSIMYRYVLSPFAEALVRRATPRWLAPNVITCLGLVPSLLAHTLIWHYSADLRGLCPRWCWAVASMSTLAYQTLDNMDGKQARRTGTSSPLGLMIDHGVDALNIVLSTLNVMAMLQVGGSPWRCLVIWITSSTPFFVATWEELHTGSLYLGAFNGPTDGVLILAASQLLCSIVEDYSAFWAADSPLPGVSRRDLTIAFYGVCVFFTVLGNATSVLRATGGGVRFRAALSLLTPFFLTHAGGALWLLSRGAGDALDAVGGPRWAAWLLGLCFLKLVLHMQLSHICAEAYQPWRRCLLLPAVIVFGSSLVGLRHPWPASTFASPSLVSGAVWCKSCVFVMAVVCTHLSVGSTRELAAILEQSVFSISPQADCKRSS